MLLTVALAYASPPMAQVGSNGFALAVGAAASATDDQLVDRDCTGENCSAIRHRSGPGGIVAVQVSPLVYGWGLVIAERSENAAAGYDEAGLALNAGGALCIRPQQDVGALAWLEGAYGTGGDPQGDQARRWWVEAGGAARFGRPDGGAQTWLGAAVLFTGSDVTEPLGGALTVPLVPVIPVEAVGGITIWGEPMSGPGSEAPRLFFTLDGHLGARVGIAGAIGVSL